MEIEGDSSKILKNKEIIIKKSKILSKFLFKNQYIIQRF